MTQTKIIVRNELDQDVPLEGLGIKATEGFVFPAIQANITETLGTGSSLFSRLPPQLSANLFQIEDPEDEVKVLMASAAGTPPGTGGVNVNDHAIDFGYATVTELRDG